MGFLKIQKWLQKPIPSETCFQSFRTANVTAELCGLAEHRKGITRDYNGHCTHDMPCSSKQAMTACLPARNHWFAGNPTIGFVALLQTKKLTVGFVPAQVTKPTVGSLTDKPTIGFKNTTNHSKKRTNLWSTHRTTPSQFAPSPSKCLGLQNLLELAMRRV